jgi:hypothetical protein
MSTHVIERRSGGGAPVASAPLKLSWGAILGGVVVALGVWILLQVLGLAAGLSAIDPNDPSSLRGAGIGTGIWSVIVPLVALFVGGLVAARTAGVVDRSTGAVHGAVLWGFTTLAGVLVLGMAVRTVVGAAANVTTTVVSGAGSAVSATAQESGSIGQALGIDANDLIAPLNRRLAAEGKPQVTAAQLEAATKDVVGTAIRQGRLDRPLLVSSIAENTNLTRADAEELATDIESRWNTQRQDVEARVGTMAEDVQTGALQAADQTGKALWWVFAGLLLGLAASIGGATVGVSRRQRLIADEQVPLATTREAHP